MVLRAKKIDPTAGTAGSGNLRVGFTTSYFTQMAAKRVELL